MTTISTLWRALESNYGLLVLAGMFYLGWKMSTWKGSIENRLSGVENLAERYAKKTDEIYTIIVGRFGRSVEQATSPVTLTEYGAELSDKIEARTIVDAYADALYQEAKDMNAYEVQEHCFLFCKNRLLDDLEKSDRDYFDKISDIAFQEGIEMEKLMRVLGIELRDRILQMKGKSHAEVDAHSPV